MPTVVGNLTGAPFQTELLVMNLLGLVNSLRKYELGWTNQVDAIRSSQHLGEIIKIILCWIVKVRIIIQHIYTITYLVNFYSILTWCRGKSLLPWMIVSAFDNFLLESISFMITLTLWLEKSISSALFIEYIIVRAIPRVPAVYYWCIVKIFRADLNENLRRKLTQANLNAHQSLFRVSDVAEHIRFGGVSYNKDYSERSPRFASLTNLDNFSLHSSSSKFDDEQDSNKRSKSLYTVMSIDSLESVDPDECHFSRIFDDNSLTPTEKAMKILNIEDSDIDEARIRLGKSTSSGRSKEERIIANVFSSSEESGQDAQIASTGNVTTNEETPPVDPSRLGNIQESAENESLAEKSEDDKTMRKVRSHDKTNDEKVIEISSRNPLSGCVCGEAEGGSVRPNDPNASGDREESSDESDGCEGDVEDDSSKDACDMEQASRESSRTQEEVTKFSTFPTTGHALLDHDSPPFPERPINDYLASVPTKHISQQQPLESMLFSHFRKEGRTVLTDHLEYAEKMPTANYHLFRIDDITVNQDRNGETPIQEALNDIGRTREGDTQPSDDDLPTGSAGVSTSTQTQGSDSWGNSLKFDKGRPAFLIDQKSFGLPITHFSHWHISDSLSTTGTRFCRLSKTKRKSEKMSDREAREMEALRAYNELTLLEDRREMEAKKKKSSFSNWIGIQDLIYTTDLSSQPLRELCEFAKSLTDDKKAKRARREKSDHVRKSQTRFRPEEKSLKFGAFNMQIDALKASISSGFSEDNKTRFRSHYAKTNARNTTARSNQDARKELSNHKKPLRFQENQTNFYQPTTRIESIEEDHEIVNIRKDKNSIDNIPSTETPHGNLENCFAKSISTSSNEAEIQHDGARNSQRISSIRETIMSIDWDFNGRSSREITFVPPHENFDWRHENFLWDILDETNTITLLQSAFSSNPENTSRGFHLGPGSTELYYVSNCLDGVVEEIMKTARMRVRHDAPSIQTSSEIDYGYSYLQEFTVTGIETGQGDSEDSLTDSDSGTYETSPDNKSRSFTATDPEMCRNGDSARSLEVQPVDEIEGKVIDGKDITKRGDSEWEEWTSKKDEKKSITDILGHQELSQLEYWTRELKELASNNHRSDSFEFTRHMQHLTALPGFCVVQKLMDFFRDFVPVSRSTTRPTNFRTASNDDPSNSSRSNGMVNQLNVPVVIEPPNDSPDARTVNDDIENYTHFYFGTLNDRVVPANELLPSRSNEEKNHRLKTNSDEELDLFNLFATSAIESPSQLRTAAAALQGAVTFQSDPSVDSYDSLYSPTGNSNTPDKTVSIGCHSSMEEFGLEPPNPAESCVGTPTDITQAEIDH